MYDTTIATKLLGQLKAFLGRISPHFHKPVARFIGDMIYGIMVEKDVKLASIVRALKEKTTPKKVKDTIRHVKQSYKLEDIRLFKYNKLKADDGELKLSRFLTPARKRLRVPAVNFSLIAK